MNVQIPIDAKFDDGDLNAELAKLTQKINAVGQSIAQANKVKFNPISKATLDDLNRINAQFEKLKRTSPNFAQDIKRTGQSGKSFLDLDWSTIATNAVAREARRYGAFNRVLAGTGVGFSPLAAPNPQGGGGTGGSGGGGAPTRPPSRPPIPPPSPGASWRKAGRDVVGAGLRAAGPVGGVADSALSAGLTGGITAGLAGLAGGIVALGIGKAIGGIVSKIGDAQNDAIGYDTLKRTLGDVNVSFRALRDGMHATSDAIDVTYPQVLKLGTEFAHISGISGELSKTLAEEVRVGGGFGRSFGIDPGQSNAFFAQMRQFQVTNTEGDSRRLALYIGEAVAKSGAFAKADEMLQAIASYTSQQTRLGLTTANVGDYSSLLAGLVGSHTPGLDPLGAANILSRVNSAFTTGGGAGEAGQNFMYMSLGKPLGLDPIQATMLREQGAFGTGSATFGQGSLYAQFAQKYGLSTPGTAAGSSETNLQLAMRRMQSVYAGKPELMLSAMSNLFGVNISQAMALATIGPEKLGGLQQALAANNVDLTKMSSTGISALAQIYSGNRDTLKDQARTLFPRLSAGEAKELDETASGGDTEKLRGELVKLTAKYGQEETEGSQTRKTIQDLDKDMMDAASKMIGPLNTMRDTLLYAFGNRGSMTAADIHKRVVDAQRKEVNDRADERISKARSQYTLLAGGLGEAAQSPEGLQQLKDAYDNMQSETAAANKERAEGLKQIDTENGIGSATGSATSGNGLPIPSSLSGTPGGGSPGSGNLNPNLMKSLSETDRMLGLPAGTSAAQIMQESGFNPNAVSPKGAMGLAQVMPETLTALEKKFGRKLNPYDPQDAVLIHRELMRENMARFGNVDNALRAYNASWDEGKWNNSETINYVNSIDKNRLTYGTPLPDGGRAPGSSVLAQQININGTFTLNNPNGQPAAAPVTMTKQVGAPMAFGSK